MKEMSSVTGSLNSHFVEQYRGFFLFRDSVIVLLCACVHTLPYRLNHLLKIMIFACVPFQLKCMNHGNDFK